jgi:hypothetical protein
MKTAKFSLFAQSLLLGSILLAACCAYSQSSAAAVGTSQMPDGMKNPHAILELLSQRNGLEGSDGWHIKLHFDQLDENGNLMYTGTVEEFFAGPKRYRIIFGGRFNQIEVANDQGLFWAGDEKWPPSPYLRAEALVVRPLQVAFARPEEMLLRTENKRDGQLDLACVLLTSKHGWVVYDRQYCTARGSAILRVEGDAYDEVVYNHIALFQDRFVPQDVGVAVHKKMIMRIGVDSIESLKGGEDDLFTPTAEMVHIPGKIEVPGRILSDECGLNRPELPFVHGAHGKVDFEYVVGTDGRVVNADVIDGPNPLREAVLETVRARRYVPFLVVGQPIEVEVKESVEVR